MRWRLSDTILRIEYKEIPVNRYLLDYGQQLLFSLIVLFFGQSLSAQVTYEVAFPNLDFDFAVELQHAGDGSNRIFVVEQTGRIIVFPNNDAVATTQQSVFLDISNEISYSAGQEIGLLGLAFHPDYAENGYFYVYYTRASSLPGVNTEMVLARFTVSDEPNLADSTSRLEIFSFDKNQLDSNHNGGKIAFGPDGYLYVSVGDGGGAGDPNDNAQNLQNIFGGILRIDVDVDGNNPLETNPDLPDGNYEIPSDNPRVGLEGLDELYAWGLRNTWKFSFDGLTGDLWGADVGQGEFEEINLISNGGNYGWDRFEANSLSDSGTSLATDGDIDPIFYYDHNQGDVSVTGGYVYRGSSTDPLLDEKYIFGDYVSGRVWSLDYDSNSGTVATSLLFRTNGQFISCFGLDESGELYFSDYGIGKNLYRISGGTTEPVQAPTEGVGFWENLENGVQGVVNAMATSRTNTVYVGGEFESAGDVSTNNIALYSPETGWNDLGTGTDGTVDAIAIGADGSVYIGGSFTSVNNVPANNIAVWDGTSWSALGEGTDGPVQALQLDADDKLFVGGNFQNAGGVLVRNIAQWTDGQWSSLTDEINEVQGANNEIRAIAIGNENRVYIGGNFDNVGGNSASRIAVWDGNRWGTLGTGTSGFVQAILVTEAYVYAGGNFSLAGDRTVNRIARWSLQNSEWEGLGIGVSGNVNALEYDGTYLYAGGSFETASDNAETEKVLYNIARWSSGLGWEALGTETEVGVSTQVNDLTFDDDLWGMYVGGNFSNAGAIAANNVALWHKGDQPIVLSDDSFTITAVDSDCPDSNNGTITARANQTADYELILSTDSGVSTYNFTDSLVITDLFPETYTIAISATDRPDYTANYQLTIAAPEVLQVATQFSASAKTLTLNMSGGSSYTVEVNGETTRTPAGELTIDLTENVTTVRVTTDTDCQGTFEQTFTLNEEGEVAAADVKIIYLNPFDNVINLNLSGIEEGAQIEVLVFTISGVQLISELCEVQNSTITLNTEILADGIYIVRLEIGDTLQSFKLIKN